MGHRIDRVQAKVTVYVEFEGIHEATLDYVPEVGDPLAIAIMEKIEAVNLAAVMAGGPIDLGIG